VRKRARAGTLYLFKSVITRFVGIVHYLIFKNNRSFSKHDLSPSLCERLAGSFSPSVCVCVCVTYFKEPYCPD
jgi:hypothetical protein